ncbi:MAG: hypothetical protein RPS99_01475 [Gammaproteobacteria bacterium]
MAPIPVTMVVKSTALVIVVTAAASIGITSKVLIVVKNPRQLPKV